MATWKPYRIADAISEIENDKFVLPVIQRRLVWDEEKMELLFDTILKGNAFGGIIVIEEEKESKPLFSFRKFTKTGEPLSSITVESLSQNQFFVIDGQQRLQSLYIGLAGSMNHKVLYFDLYSDYNNTEYEFKFENDYAKLPKSLKETEERPIKEHLWYLASDLLRKLKETNDEDPVAENIIAAKKVTEDNLKTHIQKNVKAFYKNIVTAECLGISKVTINKTKNETDNRQKIVELFRRLNDGGTKLSSFDLVASILKGFEWEMEAFLEQTLKEYEEIGLNQDNLIKLIFLLQDNHVKEMSAIEASDAQFAIASKERIEKVLKALKAFLIHAKLHDYYKEGNRSFIPLFFVCYHLFHKAISSDELEHYFDNFDANNPEFNRIYRWVYHSLLNGVFKSKGAGWIPYKTGIKKILEKIKNYKNLPFPTQELFDVYLSHPIVFTQDYNIDNLNRLDTSFLYYIMYDRSQTIRQNDIDHIHPKSLLEANGTEWNKINNVINYQLLDFGTNRGEKNGKPLKEWLEKGVENKPLYLNRHLIPESEDFWGIERYDGFLAERCRLIMDKISKYEKG